MFKLPGRERFQPTKCSALFLTVTAPLLFSYASGPDPRSTGAPGDRTCNQAGCHIGTNVNAGPGNVVLAFPGSLTYVPGERQTLTVTVTDVQMRVFGFQATARLESNLTTGQAGTFSSTDGTTQVLCDDGSPRPSSGCRAGFNVEFIEHVLSSSRNTFTFAWTPPTSASGKIRIYVSGTAANRNGQSTGDRVYTASYLLTTVDSNFPSSTETGLRFVPLPPCRLMETRLQYNFENRFGTFGPPSMLGGESRNLHPPMYGVCQIPSVVKAYVLNVTVIPKTSLDYVTVYPVGEAKPESWTVRSLDGQIVANSAIVRAGANNGISVYASDSTDVLIDVNGYFTDDATVSNLTYYPMNPCRVIETRSAYRSPAGPFGPPSMSAGQTKHFQFPSSPHCPIPAGAAAYSVTLTAIPPGPLPYLTAWPSGGSQPNVSSINSFAGRVLANSIIIPASSDGSIDVFAYAATDFIMDINGYFAPDNGRGLYYFPIPQCRVSDTRGNGLTGSFGGPIMGTNTSKTIPVPLAPGCAGISANARAYAVSATAIPGGSPMPFLTMWATGATRPNASMLNAFEGQTVTNSAIIPVGTGGGVDVYAYQQTHFVLDLSGYFARYYTETDSTGEVLVDSDLNKGSTAK